MEDSSERAYVMDDTTSTLPLIEPVETRESSPVRLWNRWVWNNGSILILVSGIFFSSVIVLVKLLDGKVPQLQILFLRAVFICIVMPLKVKFLSKPGSSTSLGKKENLHLLVMLGCSVFCHIASAWYSVTYMPIADAMAVIFANTIFTATIGVVARLENWTKYTPVGILLSVVGVVIVTRPPMIFEGSSAIWTSERVRGLELALLASLMVSSVFLVIKKLDKREGAHVLLLWQNIVISVACFVSLCLGIPHKAVFAVSLHDACLTTAAILAGMFAWITLNRGGQLTSSTLVSVLTGTELGYTLLADTFVFGEVFYPLKLLGVALIVAASAIVACTVTPVSA